MGLYYVNITLGDQRDVLIVDHVHEDYGTEKTFFSVCLGSNKNLTGSGDTVEAAIEGLFQNWELRQHLARVQEQIYSMMGNTNWYTTEAPAMMGLDAQLRAAGV